MDLDRRPVGGKLVQGQARLVEDQDGLVAVGGQRDLADIPAGLVRFLACHHQPPRGLARFHPPGAFPSAGKNAYAELTAQSQVALDLAVPAARREGSVSATT